MQDARDALALVATHAVYVFDEILLSGVHVKQQCSGDRVDVQLAHALLRGLVGGGLIFAFALNKILRTVKLI